MNYSDRIVCFLDVLGFREHIRSTLFENGKDNVDRISSISEAIRSVGQSLNIDRQPVFSPKKITQFSDSIVMSFPADKESGVTTALFEILEIQIDLAFRGFLCRGGIARGKLIHSADVLFGPAMIEAYLLESKAANYPRVILDQAIVDAGIRAHSRHNAPEDEHAGIMSLVTRDGDGMYYIDYIAKSGGDTEFPKDHPAYLLKLQELIKDGLQSRDPSIRVKHLWLKEKFNPYISTLKNNVRSDPDSEIKSAYLAISEL